MNKKQRERIERKLTHLSKENDKTEYRIERAKQKGNLESVRRCEMKFESQLGAIEAILQTLDILGYTVRWRGEDLNTAIITKN